MTKPGPKPFLDEIKRSEICALLTAGCSQREAARYVGCSHGTIGNTARREPDFAQRLRRAEMQCELDCLKKVRAGGDKSWRAAAWMLERRWPERYEKVTLRQPNAEQIAGFWDDCTHELLAGVPDDFRGAIEERLGKLADDFARRVQGCGRPEADDWLMPTEVAEEPWPQQPASADAACAAETPEAEERSADDADFAEERRASESASLEPRGLSPRKGAGEEAGQASGPAGDGCLGSSAAHSRREEARNDEEDSPIVNRDEVVAMLRAEREEILAARRAGQDRPEPDWVEELLAEGIPGDDPAYDEFAQYMGHADINAWDRAQPWYANTAEAQDAARHAVPSSPPSPSALSRAAALLCFLLLGLSWWDGAGDVLDNGRSNAACPTLPNLDHYPPNVPRLVVKDQTGRVWTSGRKTNHRITDSPRRPTIAWRRGSRLADGERSALARE